MSKVGGWGSVDPRNGQGKGNSNKFLKLEVGKEYRLRFIQDPHEVRKYFVKHEDGSSKTATTDAGSKCVVLAHKGEDGKPLYPQRVKYAVNCIDRSDQSFKVVELPPTVAQVIRDWGTANNVHPGKKNGVDFKIQVTRQGSDYRTTRYTCIPLNATPFTAEELAKIEEGVYDLSEMFKITPQSEIEEVLGIVKASSSKPGSKSSVDDDDDDFKPKVKKAQTVASSDDDELDNF